MALQGTLRAISGQVDDVADMLAVFDRELDDDTASTAYKNAIKARVKARLQVALTALTNVVSAL